MPNYNPVPNMNIKDTPKPSAKTEVGKFRRDLGKFTRDKVPDELIELFDFYKGLDTKKIDYLTELKNVYLVLQKAMLPSLIDKIHNGEMLNRKELDALRLIKDTLVESHKLKYGDHKVIEKHVTYDDIRRAMCSDKTIIDAKVISDEPTEDSMQDRDSQKVQVDI